MSIVKGFTNLVLGKQKGLNKRRKILCDACPISNYGQSKLCKKSLGGCGCLLSAKRSDPDEKCPKNYW